jgi:hypothetical protein
LTVREVVVREGFFSHRVGLVDLTVRWRGLKVPPHSPILPLIRSIKLPTVCHLVGVGDGW